MDWEAWLRTAARRPSDKEDDKRDRTEQQIRDALNAYEPLRGRPYRVYAKGSYANNTNVLLNFDVDVAVEYYGYFYSDLAFDLEGHDDSDVGVYPSEDPYTTGQFKADVRTALEAAFSKAAVTPGRIAYRVRERKTTLPADVVPCWEYRRYDGFDYAGKPILHVGSRVFPSDGGYINNFPKIQVERGTAKNEPWRTSRRYKRMVRCLKKLQTKLVENGVLDEELPSYLIECLVFNVPDNAFGTDSYLTDMRQVLGYLWGEMKSDGKWNDFEEVHGLAYLFRGGRSWTRAQVHKMVDKAWDEVGIS